MLRWLAPWFAVSLLWAQSPPVRQAPYYTAGSIANAATNLAGPLSPNALVSLYGANLSAATRAISPDDLRGDALPTALIGTGVRVLIDSIAVPVLFVSPNQVNFLIPPNMRVGPHKLVLIFDSKAGPEVDLPLESVSPGLFPFDPGHLIATHLDGSLLAADAPARPGEIIVVYAAGLGQTVPRLVSLTIPRTAAWLDQLPNFAVLLNGEPLAPASILYAGICPNFGGLYQINLRLPETLADDPELRLSIAGTVSPEGTRIYHRGSVQ